MVSIGHHPCELSPTRPTIRGPCTRKVLSPKLTISIPVPGCRVDVDHPKAGHFGAFYLMFIYHIHSRRNTSALAPLQVTRRPPSSIPFRAPPSTSACRMLETATRPHTANPVSPSLRTQEGSKWRARHGSPVRNVNLDATRPFIQMLEQSLSVYTIRSWIARLRQTLPGCFGSTSFLSHIYHHFIPVRPRGSTSACLCSLVFGERALDQFVVPSSTGCHPSCNASSRRDSCAACVCDL